MKTILPAFFSLCAALVLAGCGVQYRQGLEAVRLHQVEDSFDHRKLALSPELEKRILALDPTDVTAKDVREVLAHAPAPRIINIHGGTGWVSSYMVSFSDFLIGMGYPAGSLTNPGDGTYSFSCYESSEKIAGVIAWYYEKEGLRPMLVGHSQGGMQVVKVLYKFSGGSNAQLHVWSPLTWRREDRCEIVDPLTGLYRPAADLRIPFATAVGAGGLTRLLPNQWDMDFRLHLIPDSAEEFTGFCKGNDLLGGDFLGFGSANYYQAANKASVRNVWLPIYYSHMRIPDTRHLLKDPQIVDWINRYRPPQEAIARPELDVKFANDSSNILWAADVWYSIKKHWVLELQRLIRAEHARDE
jgi:pimeloyl-ACP methyl ester carboxylesterase